MLSSRISKWLKGLHQDDFGFLYFGGHGRTDEDGHALLACRDAEESSDAGWLDLNQLLHSFRHGRLLVVLDCCHAGASLSAITQDVLPVQADRQIQFLGACPAHETTPALSPLTPLLVQELRGKPQTPPMIASSIEARLPAAIVGGTWGGAGNVLLNPGGTGALEAYRKSVVHAIGLRQPSWHYTHATLDTTMLEELLVKQTLRVTEPAGFEGTASSLFRGSLQELLRLLPGDGGWVTGRWLVSGPPGAGKTTLLQGLARELARDEKSRFLPVWAPAPWLAELGDAPLLAQVASPACDGVPDMRGFLEAAARDGRVALLCDGLDEVPSRLRHLVAARLHMLADEWTGPIIATTRDDAAPLAAPFVELRIGEPSRDLHFEFLRSVLAARDRLDEFEWLSWLLNNQRDGFGEAIDNPLFMSLVTSILLSEDHERATPARTHLEFIDILLRGRHRVVSHRSRTHTTVAPHSSRAMRALVRFGWELTDRSPASQAAEFLSEESIVASFAASSSNPLELLEEIGSKAGFMIREPRSDGWRFRFATHRNVLGARALADAYIAGPHVLTLRPPQASRVAGNGPITNEWALAAGLLDSPDSLILRLLEIDEVLAAAAVSNAHTVSAATLLRFGARPLPAGESTVAARRAAVLSLASKIHDPATAIRLVGELTERATSPEQLSFLDEACNLLRLRWRSKHGDIEAARTAIYQSLPEPPVDMIPWSEEIPAGMYWIGTRDSAVWEHSNPRRRIAIPTAFRLAQTPVTNAQWRTFQRGYEPASRNGVPIAELENHPVVGISFHAMLAFCRWVSFRTPDGGNAGVRLPNEVEWECGARGPIAGSEFSTERWWFGDDEADLEEFAWYRDNSGGRMHPVATTRGGANPWNLHDMYGNIWELCADGHQEPNPREMMQPGGRVVRGGRFASDAIRCQSAYRAVTHDMLRVEDVGFRIVRPTE